MVPSAATFVQQLTIALSAVVVASALAWLVGYAVSYVWDERRRRRESDLEALAIFYRIYGEFFATWKLWDAQKRYGDKLSSPDNVQWTLLERAERAEGSFEALLVKLASERHLTKDDKMLLGCFREAYQMLRESIRANEPLEWWASPGKGEGWDQYRAFKALAGYVASTLEDSPRGRLLQPAPKSPCKGEAIAALFEITDRGTFHGKWWVIAPAILPPS